MTNAFSFNLITSETATDLSQTVNEHLADGWRLFGKPFWGGDHLYQAVILKKGSRKRLRKTTEDG